MIKIISLKELEIRIINLNLRKFSLQIIRKKKWITSNPIREEGESESAIKLILGV